MVLVLVCDRWPLIHCRVSWITLSVLHFQWRLLSLRLLKISFAKLTQTKFPPFPSINNIGNLSVTGVHPSDLLSSSDWNTTMLHQHDFSAAAGTRTSYTVKSWSSALPSYIQSKVPPSPDCKVLLIRIWFLTSARFCPTVQALQGPWAIFSLDTSKVEIHIHYLVSSFHQRFWKWPRFQQVEQSNPSTVSCLDDG